MATKVLKLDSFHKSHPGYIVFGLAEASLAYLFGSLAINSGSIWEYVLMLVLLVGLLQNIVQMVRKVIRS